MRKLLLSTAAVAAIAMTFWLIRSTLSQTPANRASSENVRKSPSSEEWRHELTQIRRELTRLEWNQRTSANTVAREPTREEPDAPEPERDEVSAMAQMSGAEQRAAQTDLLVEQMRREGIDPMWAREAEVQIRDRWTAQSMFGVISTDVECRVTLCRLDLFFERLELREDAVAMLPRLIPWDFEGYYRAADHDEQHLIVYVTREGATLPSLAMVPATGMTPSGNHQ